MPKNGASSTKKRIAIVGTSRTTRHMAPFGNTDWEIWTLGANYKEENAPRKDIHFELHDFGEGKRRWSPEYLRWLRRPEMPLITQRQTIDCPTAEAYPLKEVEKEFPRCYWTCSFSYMLALAMIRGADEIGLYGAELAQDLEYAWQRPSVEYLVGLAEGRGIKVDIPDTSDICKTACRYAFETIGGQDQRAFRKMCEARSAELKREIAMGNDRIAQEHARLKVLAGAEEWHRWATQLVPLPYPENDCDAEISNGNGHATSENEAVGLSDVGQLRERGSVPNVSGAGPATGK